MPPLAPAPGVARFTFKGTCNGINVFNVMHIKGHTGAAWNATDLHAVNVAADAAFRAYLLPWCSTDYTYIGSYAVDLTDAFGVDDTVPASSAGGRGSIGRIQSMACCITWKTSGHWRGGHGRTYLNGGGGGDFTNPTTWSGSYVTGTMAGANNFMLAVNTPTAGTTPALVILRRYSEKAPIPSGPIALPVTAAVVDSRIDTQRRRLGRDR